MYPSSYSNQDNSFSNYNLDNHSKPSQDYYQPELFQQQQQRPLISSEHNYHDHTFIVAHEHSNPKTSTTNLQSMNNSSSNKNYVILQNNFLKGRRASKKDRHSKINTAKGPRDRRMRLSLDVAKKFFKLQDMLGFDKASNTIEWLLMKSKPAIQDLLPHHLNNGSCSLISLSNSASSASECEVMSGIDDLSMEKSKDGKVIIVDNSKSTSCSINKEKKRLDRGVRKSVYMHHSLAKETREQARARARKRTSEKRNNKLGGGDHAAGVSGCDQFAKFRPHFDQAMDQNVNRSGSWIPFGENQVQTTDQGEYPSSHFQFKQGVVGDNSSGMPFGWSSSFLFNYQHNNSGPSHENQFNDFPILGKPWDQGNEN